MTNEIKTKSNTRYHIDRYTFNIIETTTCNGYVSTNTAHYTSWKEDEDKILQQFKDKLVDA